MWHASECVGKTASSLSRLTGPWPGSASSAEALSAVRRYAELDANAISHLPAEPGEDGEKGTHRSHLDVRTRSQAEVWNWFRLSGREWDVVRILDGREGDGWEAYPKEDDWPQPGRGREQAGVGQERDRETIRLPAAATIKPKHRSAPEHVHGDPNVTEQV